MHFLDTKAIQRQTGPDDVDDGIDRPYLMKVDLLDTRPMGVGLGLGQFRENDHRPLANGGGQTSVLDDLPDVFQMPVGLVRGFNANLELSGRETLFSDAFGRQ